MLSSGLSLWGTQISHTLPFSTLFPHWWISLSNLLPSPLYPLEMSSLDKLLALCLFEISQISSLTWDNAPFRKHGVLGMPFCSDRSKAASLSLWPRQFPQLLSFSSQFEEHLCSPLFNFPNHAIHITSFSSFASKIPVQSWASVDVYSHFSLPCLVLFSVQPSPTHAWILSCTLSHPKFHHLSFLDTESFPFLDKGGTRLGLTLKGGKMESSSVLQAAQNALLFWFREGGNPSKRQQKKPLTAPSDHHPGKLSLLMIVTKSSIFHPQRLSILYWAQNWVCDYFWYLV